MTLGTEGHEAQSATTDATEDAVEQAAPVHASPTPPHPQSVQAYDEEPVSWMYGAARERIGRTWRAMRRWLVANTFTPSWALEGLRAPAVGYIVAVTAQLLAVALVYVLIRWFGDFSFPSAPQLLAIAVVALNWGAGPSVVSAIVATLFINFVAVRPNIGSTPTGPRQVVELGIFLITGLGISVLASQTERARRASSTLASRLTNEQARLETIIDAAPDMISIHDASGAIVRRNRAAKQVAPDVRGDERIDEAQSVYGLHDLHDLQGRALARNELPVSRALRGQTVDNLELLSRLSDGEHVLSVSVAPFRDPWGAILGAVAVTHDITPLRRSEQAAAERAGQLEATFDALVDGVVVFDTDGTLVEMNDAAQRLIGLNESPDFYERPLQERMARLHMRDERGIAIPLERLPQQRVLAGEVLQGLDADDYLLHTLDGREVRVNIGGAPVCSGGVIAGGVLTLRDVTEQRQLEREATERAAQIEATYDSMTDGVVVYDPAGSVLRMNAEARAIFGRGVGAERTGVSLSERMQLMELLDEQGYPLDHDAWPTARILAGETLRSASAYDTSFVARDGTRIWLAITGAPVRDARGEIAAGIVIYRDVTERRRLEARTHDALVALLTMASTLVEPTGTDAGDAARLVAQRLIDLTRTVLDCTRIAVSERDRQTDVMHALAVTGLTPEQERHWWAEQQALEQQGTRFSDGPDQQVIAQLRTGEVLTFDLTKPPYAAAPNPYGIRSVLIAPMCLGNELIGMITYDYGGADHVFTQAELLLAGGVARLAALVLERERLLRESAEGRARVLALEDATVRMDGFLGIASHELKTPLTTIKANIQLTERRLRAVNPSAANLADELRRVSAASDMMERTQRQVARLDRLVNDLLDVSRIHAGKLELRIEPIDLAEIVRENVHEQRTAWLGRPIELTVPEQPLIIHADADRIGQVVTNYLTNALKYSAEDAPVAVTLHLDAAGHARVAVQDRGPGLPPEEQQRVWERFHRAPGIEVQSGSGVGLGLGLHISRELIERHGGAVGLESTLGEGSTFSFTLPLAEA